MKIYITNSNQRKIIYDILNIFYDHKDFDFINDEENSDLKIYEKVIIFKGKSHPYETNEDLKSTLYNILVDLTAYRSPWGMLTGSKPSKLLKNASPHQIKAKYLVSDEKIDLLTSVRNQQNKLDFDKNAFSLYINIPFCPSRCDYCSYPTLIGVNHDKSQYMTYLIREIMEIDLPAKLDSIYIGGGTPSFLNASDVKNLLAAINARFTYEEFTFEAGREDTLDIKKLDILKAGGVSRISLNPQTFNREVLKNLNRDLDLDHFIKIYTYAKNLGLIVNMDFIIGLVGESYEDFAKNFKILNKLMPDNITFHSLAIKSGSKLSEKSQRGQQEDALALSKMIKTFTESLAYKPYYLYRQKNIVSNLENVGYQRNNTAQRYNIIINEEIANIIGLGMNANSKLMNGQKFRNSKNLRDYYRDFDKNLKAKNQMIGAYRKDIR